jgi:hypothetical protein
MERDDPKDTRAGLVQVKVWGMDSDGQAFVRIATAHERSLHGARLDGISCIRTTGEVIGVQYGDRKGRFRVVWVGAPNSAQAGQIGIRALEPDNCIWPTDISQDTARPAISGPARKERRQHPRYRCTGDVEFVVRGSGMKAWAKLADINMGGCYLEHTLAPSVGSELQLTIRARALPAFTVTGQVRTSVPGVGMGIEFSKFESDSRDRLAELVAKLKPPSAAGPAKTAASAVSTAPPTNNDLTTLLAAIEQFFEGNNIMSREEFQQIVKAVRSRATSASK